MARKKKSAKFAKMRRRRMRNTIILLLLLTLIGGGCAAIYYFFLLGAGVELPAAFEAAEHFPGRDYAEDRQIQEGFAKNLCVSAEGSIPLEGVALDPSQYGGLFDLDGKRVLFGQNIYEKLYPASMTKIMTAIVALKNGTLTDLVTVSQSALVLEEGSQLCGFQPGDQLTLEQLIQGLLIHSGNDAAAAIAEYVGGTQENFIQMMNEECARLGMTNTHFTNPHGLQDTEHYTSIYDIYLMLNEALRYPKFVEIIQMGAFNVQYQNAFGQVNSIYLESTDHYLTGEATGPKGVTILGGKTGTTDEAGNCLALVSQNEYGKTFITVVANAFDKPELYQQMNQLLKHINS